MRWTPARLGLAALALALLTAGLVLWPGEEAIQASSPSASMGGARPAPVVRSLQDTVPDGDLQSMQTANGTTVSGALAYGELRRLFDYYLSTVGEQSIEAITAQIQSELQRRLPSPQAQKAQRLLGLYIAFKRELVDLEAKPDLSGNAVAAVRKRLLAMQDLRARYFTAD
jgi:lipase chaperone LimK